MAYRLVLEVSVRVSASPTAFGIMAYRLVLEIVRRTPLGKEGSSMGQAVDIACTPELADLLADDDVIYTATQIFDALSDFTRFKILGALSLGECSVSELEEVCRVSQSAVSHQLRLLRDRRLVTARREGQRSYYAIADEHVVTLIRVGLEHAGHTFWDL